MYRVRSVVLSWSFVFDFSHVCEEGDAESNKFVKQCELSGGAETSRVRSGQSASNYYNRLAAGCHMRFILGHKKGHAAQKNLQDRSILAARFSSNTGNCFTTEKVRFVLYWPCPQRIISTRGEEHLERQPFHALLFDRKTIYWPAFGFRQILPPATMRASI